MQMLQCLHIDLAALDGSDAVGGGAGSGERRDRGNAVCDGGPAYRLFVEERIHAIGRVDDQLNLPTLDEVHDVRTSFFHLVHTFAGDSRLFQRIGRAMSGNDGEAEVEETLGERRNVDLVTLVDAD